MESKEAIVIFSGGCKRSENGDWVSSGFKKSDCGPIGSIIRILAGKYVFEEDPRRFVIVSGGRAKCDGLLPKNLCLSNILKKELVRLGIPENSIIEEDKSNNTYQHLYELLSMIEKNLFKQIFIISQSYHLPRIEAMISYVPAFAKIKNIISLVAAEDVVIKHDPSWKFVIKEAYQCEPTLGVIAKEAEGVRQIKKGIYKFA